VAYQSDAFARAARIVGQLAGTLTKASQAGGARYVSVDFSGHDITKDYSTAASYVFAPKIHVFASYYGLGGGSFEVTASPVQRCTPLSRNAQGGSCEKTFFKTLSGKWKGQTGTVIIDFWSNDFPHLTPIGQGYIADRIISTMGLK
jgi:hypothetical protein